MNKNIIKVMVVGFACFAFCGTTLAAPGRGNGGRTPQKTPTHQTNPAQQRRNEDHRAPVQPRIAAPAPHGAPVAHHAPAPAPHHHEPPPAPHHGGHHEGAGWVALGATVIGGIVGGIIGACN